MQAKYPLKVQTIRTKGSKPRYYVYLPMPLAAALGMRSGEQVHWELLDRGELRLVRDEPPSPGGQETERPQGQGEGK